MSDKQTEIIDTLLEAMKTPGKWERMRNDSHNHCNYETLRAYRGMNSLLLAVIAMDRGYKGKQRLTFKQIQKLGGVLKKGSKGANVIFNAPKKTEDKETGEIKKGRISATYTVFNIDCIEGLEYKAPIEYENKPIEDAMQLCMDYMKREGIQYNQSNNNKCYYTPIMDSITMVDIKMFKTKEAFHSTLFHEIIHSTGHEKRLNRKLEMLAPFGSETYSIEELVAEFGQALFSGMYGILDITQSSAYLASRLEGIKKDNRQKEVYRAIQRAFKAYDFILGNTINND